MKPTVRPAPPHHFSYLYGRVGLHITGHFCALEAIDLATERIHGMVGFDNFTPNGVDMHVVLEGLRGTRALLKPAFSFAFSNGRSITHAHVRSDNPKSLELAMTAGFKPAHVSKDWHGRGVDDVLFELRREDCRFLEELKNA